MFLEGRQALVRYGGVLFLGAIKRDYNEPGWPYIGPCVKDNERKVRVTAECICISDNHEMYNWIIGIMVEMEHQFSLNQIRFIFSDQLITQEMIVQLGVEETCVLHGDPYHILNKVFPENFGIMYDSLFPFLDNMLMGKEEEFETDFEAAKKIATSSTQIKHSGTYSL